MTSKLLALSHKVVDEPKDGATRQLQKKLWGLGKALRIWLRLWKCNSWLRAYACGTALFFTATQHNAASHQFDLARLSSTFFRQLAKVYQFRSC